VQSVATKNRPIVICVADMKMIFRVTLTQQYVGDCTPII